MSAQWMPYTVLQLRESSMTMQLPLAPVSEVDYPTSDGRPFAEGDLHREVMTDVIQVLEEYFENDPLVYVSGNLLVFYKEGDPGKFIAPDAFVVRGVPKHPRDHYLIWREGRSPQVAIEITSRMTRKEDSRLKPALYRTHLGVDEYFLFDPRAEYLRPVLQGYRRRDDGFVAIEPIDGRLPSEMLGLHLVAVGVQLRFYEPRKQAILPTIHERISMSQAISARLHRE